MSVTARERPLTIGEVSRILGVHPQRIRRLERRGVLPLPGRAPVSGDRYYLPIHVPRLKALIQESVGGQT